MEYDELIRTFRGVASTAQLLQSGQTADEIRAAVAEGELDRLRHGWLAVREADPDVAETVGSGAIVSCVSALEYRGIWVPEGAEHGHSRVTRHERRQSGDRCRRYGRPTPARAAIDDVPTALQYAARCLDPEGFLVVCDSALNGEHLTHSDLRDQFSRAPQRLRRLINRCHPGAQSGTESMVRDRLSRAGFSVRVQYPVPGVGHVDLLVGELLALEIDGKAHHTGEERYEYDRWRDRQLSLRGLIPIRLTYGQVVNHWASTFADLSLLCRRRRHRDRRAVEAQDRLRNPPASRQEPPRSA
jgi:very-short-patch-repair endonuclease